MPALTVRGRRTHRPAGPLADVDLLDGGGDLVPLAHGEVEDEPEDREEHELARAGGAEPEAAMAGRVREVVADRRTEWPGEHVGDPEREHRVDLEHLPGD